MLTVLFIPYKYPCNCLEIFISYSMQLDIYWGIQDKPSQAFCRQNISKVMYMTFFYTKNKHMSKLCQPQSKLKLICFGSFGWICLVW